MTSQGGRACKPPTKSRKRGASDADDLAPASKKAKTTDATESESDEDEPEPVVSNKQRKPRKGKEKYDKLATAPSIKIGFPNGNLTAAEIVAYLPNWLKSAPVIRRLILNGFSSCVLQFMINESRDLSPKGDISTNTVMIMMRNAMRRAGFSKWIVQEMYKWRPMEWVAEDLGIDEYQMPPPEIPVEFAPVDVPFKDLARLVKRHPTGADALDLTRCIRHHVNHPDEEWYFPADFESLVDFLGGPLTVRRQHTDEQALQRWERVRRPAAVQRPPRRNRAPRAEKRLKKRTAPSPDMNGTSEPASSMRDGEGPGEASPSLEPYDRQYRQLFPHGEAFFGDRSSDAGAQDAHYPRLFTLSPSQEPNFLAVDHTLHPMAGADVYSAGGENEPIGKRDDVLERVEVSSNGGNELVQPSALLSPHTSAQLDDWTRTALFHGGPHDGFIGDPFSEAPGSFSDGMPSNGDMVFREHEPNVARMFHASDLEHLETLDNSQNGIYDSPGSQAAGPRQRQSPKTPRETPGLDLDLGASVAIGYGDEHIPGVVAMQGPQELQNQLSDISNADELPLHYYQHAQYSQPAAEELHFAGWFTRPLLEMSPSPADFSNLAENVRWVHARAQYAQFVHPNEPQYLEDKSSWTDEPEHMAFITATRQATGWVSQQLAAAMYAQQWPPFDDMAFAAGCEAAQPATYGFADVAAMPLERAVPGDVATG